MDDVKYKYLSDMLDLMAEKQFLPTDMDPTKKAQLEKSLSERAKSLRTQFEKDWKKLKDEATSSEEREQLKENLENLAQALPEFAMGTISAITAFKNGDAIGGSAAIMDICASLTPLLAGLAAAGGPPGMLVGAIFALVGQILRFFAPDSKSLTEEIEDLLRDLNAEKTQQDIRTVHERITAYASSLRDAAQRASTALDTRGSLLNLMILGEIVKALNPIEGNIVTRFGDVMNWLKEPKNHTLDLWPLILSAACQAWADMMAAALTLLSLVHTDQLQKQYESAAQLTDPEKTRDIEKALMKLQARVISRLVMLKHDNDSVRKDGIGVDRHYLWVFGSGGLACATHASVMRCLNEKKGTPRWMGHFPNHLLYEGNQNPTPRPDPKPLLGLVDLCPCEDGTLVAALYTRTVVKKSYGGKSMHHYYEFVDYNGLYSAVYDTDLEKGTIDVDWTKIGNATGVRVQKVPVFCWSLFESLPEMLDRLADKLDSV